MNPSYFRSRRCCCIWAMLSSATPTTMRSDVPPNWNGTFIQLPMMFGISAITGTAPRAYDISHEFRARGVPVVLGGVHPTLVPEEAAAHADSVVVGYAEESWPQLLRDLRDGRLRDRYVQSPNHSLAGLRPFRRDLLPRHRHRKSNRSQHLPTNLQPLLRRHRSRSVR